MGAGIAREIAKRYPEAYQADKATESGDKSKLGTYTFAKFKQASAFLKGHNLFVVNAYTQYRYGRDGKCYFDYDAFESVMKKINEDFKGKLIVMPWIGCGLAGGSQTKVKEILNRVITKCKVTICDLNE